MTDFRELTHLEGRVLAHGQEEFSGRMYLMMEGMDGKVHFLYQTDEIQEARRQGQLRVNSFTRIEKQFSEEGRPFLHIEDLGDAFELLHNNTHFGKIALQLIHQGVTRSRELGEDGWDNIRMQLISAFLGRDRENVRGDQEASHAEVHPHPASRMRHRLLPSSGTEAS